MTKLTKEELTLQMPKFTARMDDSTREQRLKEMVWWKDWAQKHVMDVITSNRSPGHPIVFANESFVMRALPLLADRREDEDAQHILNHLDYIESLLT